MSEQRDLIVLDAGDVLHDAFAVRGPHINQSVERVSALSLGLPFVQKTAIDGVVL